MQLIVPTLHRCRLSTSQKCAGVPRADSAEPAAHVQTLRLLQPRHQLRPRQALRPQVLPDGPQAEGDSDRGPEPESSDAGVCEGLHQDRELQREAGRRRGRQGGNHYHKQPRQHSRRVGFVSGNNQLLKSNMESGKFNITKYSGHD